MVLDFTLQVLKILMIVIVITLYSPRYLGQETAKEPFGLLVKLLSVYLSITLGGGFTALSFLIAERQAGRL